ncbi:MAG: glycosyltransferase [Candidatus Limiplasma sp.]|nr:glycosyltransferase [Candidatus Limiplasma sp.]
MKKEPQQSKGMHRGTDMDKGTVLYLGGFELPDKNAAAHRVLSNAKLFRSQGYHVVLIGTDKDLAPTGPISGTKKEIQGFPSYSLPYPRSKGQWLRHVTGIRWLQEIFSLYPDIRMIVCYNYPSIALQRILRIGKANGIKVVADCSEWYGAKGNGWLFCIVKGLDTFYRMRMLHKKADGLIVISEFLKSYYSHCENVMMLPPLIDSGEEKWARRTMRPKEKLTFVYAGSPGRKERLDLLVEALSKVPCDYLLYMVGVTESEVLRMYPALAEKISAQQGHVSFQGRLSHQETLDLLKTADYSCFFRERNRTTMAGFPTKFVEALTIGTDVITNTSGDLMKYQHLPQVHLVSLQNLREDVANVVFQSRGKNDEEMRRPSTLFHYENYEEPFGSFLQAVFSRRNPTEKQGKNPGFLLVI